MTPRNLFVTVEGLSGSGKTTIAKLLAERWAARYYKTPPAMFTPIREIVDSNASPLARHLFYYAGIAQASIEIETMLREHAVVCDKYLATMVAYSRAAGVTVDIPPATLVLHPDFTFLLEVPEDVRLRRLALRGTITPVHREFLKMETDLRVAQHFEQPGVLKIDNSMSDVVSALATITTYTKGRDVRCH